MTRPVRATRAGLLAAVLVLGCTPAAKQPVPLGQDEQALVNVGLAYRDASNALQRGPANENELKPYLKKYGDPDKLLVSPRDGQPYHITWGLTPSRPSPKAIGQRFLVYEKAGKDGKRYALDLMLKVHQLSEKEFAKQHGPG